MVHFYCMITLSLVHVHSDLGIYTLYALIDFFSLQHMPTTSTKWTPTTCTLHMIIPLLCTTEGKIDFGH